jgi:hypothetical protein
MRFGFVLVFEEIVEALIGSIIRSAQVENSPRVSRRRSRRLVAGSALRDGRGDLGGGFGQEFAAHSTEAVVAGIFIAAMGAAHDGCFLRQRPGSTMVRLGLWSSLMPRGSVFANN